MIHQKTFKINNPKNWDNDIDASVKYFYDAFTIYPNIILFNSYMVLRIDILANENKDNLKDEFGIKPDISTFAQIDSFASEDYNLEIYLDEKLPDNYYTLIYDSNPSGDDGEPLPEDNSISHDLMKKAI